MMIEHSFIDSTHQKRLAIITFNKEKSLNAQDLSMVKDIAKLLDDWQTDPSIAAIVMRGAGEKAFCAGGDIKGLYYALDTDTKQGICEFFEHEYRLMYQIYTYTKPIIAWGSGIVMGGGLGILAGCSHKIATPTTIMAMPEVSIGLFPDAGGSYFLNRMMNKVGLFLGLTGARFSGADAYYLGLADFLMPADDYQAMIAALLALEWSADDRQNFAKVSQALNQRHRASLSQPSQLLNAMDDIHHLMNAGDLIKIDKAINAYAGNNDFIQAAKASFVAGSPITKALTYALYYKCKPLSLKEILSLELHTAIACCLVGDFQEGVRALLIDKDKNPHWRYSLEEIGDTYIQDYFKSPYQGKHPFDDL